MCRRQPPPALVQDPQRRGRFLREGVRRDLVGMCGRKGGAQAGLTHQTGHKRLSCWVILGDLSQGSHHSCRVDHCLRDKDDQDAIGRLVIQHSCQCLPVVVLARATKHIDRSGDLRIRKQEAAQSSLRVRASAGQREPERFQGVGRKRCRSAGIGEDSDPPAREWRLIFQRHGPVEHLLNGGAQGDAGLPADSAKRRVGASQGACMRCRGSLSTRGLPRLEGQDGLVQSSISQRRDESGTTFDIFQIERDNLSLIIRGQFRQHVCLIDIGFVAHAEHATEADAATDDPIDDATAERSRLRKESDVPLGGHGAHERRVERRVCVHDADAVWSHYAQSGAPRDLDHLALERGAILAHFAKATGNDHGRFDAAPAAGLYLGGHAGGGNDEDGQLDRIGHGHNSGVAATAKDGVRFGIDWINGSRVAGGGIEQIP